MADPFLDLYAANPAAGRTAALAALDESTNPLELALAHRMLGVGDRDSGNPAAALTHLRKAAHYAQLTGDPYTHADILATRGGTRVILGDPRGGIQDLSIAAKHATGLMLGTVLYRRGVARLLLGDAAKALLDAEAALALLRPHGDTPWLSRAFQLLGESQLQSGRPKEAAQSFAECLSRLGDDAGYEAVRLRIMRTWLSFLLGDLPQALAMFDVAEIGSIEDGRLRAEVAVRLATIRLAAGLGDAAFDCLEALDPASVPPSSAAQARALLARVLLFAREPSAGEVASAAAKDLRRMGLRLDAAEAALTALEVGLADGFSPPSRQRPEDVARDLVVTGSQLAVDGWVVAGKIAVRRGSPSRAAEAYAKGAAYRGSTDLLAAASGWLSHAHELELGQNAGVLRACGRGLDALDEYREIMGSSEIRASLTHRGRELAEVALRHAAHDPRTLLIWSERWRATSLAQRPVTPQGEIAPAVAMLRDRSRRIAEARAAGEPTDALERERRSLERKLRAEHHQQRAESRGSIKRFNVAELVAGVADGAFIELVDVDGILHVLVVSKGRVRRVVAGETKAALDLAEAGRSALRRAARTGRFAPGDLGGRFQDAVLGKAVRMLPDGPVTISPTAALHGAPFALMPALTDRPFSIVPSAAQWLRAREVPMPITNSRALISGPRLLTGGAEVARLATRYPDATVLTHDAATVEATMNAIDGAHLAHLATHGTFRADSPLFSALELADGPLSVYELERLKRAPYRTILSACDSGVLAPVGAQEVLGLASALFSLGSAGLVCSIAEVNDEATADLMMDVHAALDRGRAPAEALAQVRSEADPIRLATAAAFVALGV